MILNEEKSNFRNKQKVKRNTNQKKKRKGGNSLREITGKKKENT